MKRVFTQINPNQRHALHDGLQKQNTLYSVLACRVGVTISLNRRAPRREAFRCRGQQLDAIVRFAEEHKLDDRTFQFVVAEYCRYRSKAA